MPFPHRRVNGLQLALPRLHERIGHSGHVVFVLLEFDFMWPVLILGPELIILHVCSEEILGADGRVRSDDGRLSAVALAE